MEKLKDWLEGFIIEGKTLNRTNLLYSLFQISFTLTVAQNMYKFMHFDLHSKNIMLRRIKNKINIYKIGKRYFYTLFDFETVIIDFGFSRLETEPYEIIPKIKYSRPAPQKSYANIKDYFDFYAFNPYLDLASLFNNMFQHIRATPDIDDGLDFFVSIYKLFLNVEDDEEFIQLIPELYISGYGQWRANPSLITLKKIDNLKRKIPSSPRSFLTKLIAFISGAMKIQKNMTLGYLKNYNFGISENFNIDFPGYDVKLFKIPSPIYEYRLTAIIKEKNIINIDSKIRIYIKNKIDRHNYQIYEYSHNLKEIKHKKSNYLKKDQIFSYAKIYQNENNYSFNIQCCRIDTRSYFRSKYVKSGIGINASFYNSENFIPIGPFKSDDIISNNPIPEYYKKYYGVVCINKGFLSFDFNLDDIYLDKTYTQYLTSGPLLIKNGEIVFNEEDVLEEKNIFQCENKGYSKYDNKNILDCSNKEYYLSDATNPIQRTLICIDNKDIIYFYYFENPGVDLVFLAKYFFNQNKFKYVLNLGGGVNSQMVWKHEFDNYMYQTNENHNFSYPVGNIISFIKR